MILSISKCKTLFFTHFYKVLFLNILPIILAALGLADPIISGKIIDIFVTSSLKSNSTFHTAFQSLIPLLILQLSLIFTKFLFGVIKSLFQTWFNQLFTRSIRYKLYNIYLNQFASFFHDNEVGELNSRLNEAAGFSSLAVLPSSIATNILSISVSIGIVLSYDWTFIALVLGEIPVKVVVTFFYGKWIGKQSNKLNIERGENQNYILEKLNLYSSIQRTNTQPLFLDNYRTSLKIIDTRIMKITKRQAIIMLPMVLYQMIFYVLTSYIALKNIISGKMTVGDFTVFLQYSEVMKSSIENIVNIYPSWKKSQGNLQKVCKYLYETPYKLIDNDSFPSFNIHSISISNLSFQYPNATLPSLHSISKTFHSNTCHAIVGSTSSGKSTILKLLAKMHDTTGIHLHLDSPLTLRSSLSNIPRETWYANIFYLKQNIDYFQSLSLLDNTLLGIQNPNLSLLESLISELQLDDLFQRRTEFTTLSGGELQRFGLIRAILSQKPVILLDEPTSALNPQLKKVYFDTLHKYTSSSICIIVSHDLSHITHFQDIIVLENGSITSSGTHSHLLDHSTWYHDNFSTSS